MVIIHVDKGMKLTFQYQENSSLVKKIDVNNNYYSNNYRVHWSQTFSLLYLKLMFTFFILMLGLPTLLTNLCYFILIYSIF